MIDDGTYTGVVDRIVDGVAAILLERDDEVVDEISVDPTMLPADARHEGAVVEVTVETGDVTDITYDEDATRDRKSTAQERFDRLAERPPDEDDG